jgi:hypothetical protein
MWFKRPGDEYFVIGTLQRRRYLPTLPFRPLGGPA